MASLTAFIFATALVFGFTSYAAIDCKPGMGNCPDSGYGNDPLPHPPSQPDSSVYLAIGYTEISSPDCNSYDLSKAREMARLDAWRMARIEFNGKDIVERPGSFWSQNCEKGFYSNSAPGLSWIVQYFAKFERKK